MRMELEKKGQGVDIDATFQVLHKRISALEDRLGPVAGSGTDHWTQHSDGKDYPGSYGVGPLKPFAVTDTERAQASWIQSPKKV